MRICMLTYYYWPIPAGGAENQCRKLVKELCLRGHTCQVLTVRARNLPRFAIDLGASIIRIANFENFISKFRNLDDEEKVVEKISKQIDQERHPNHQARALAYLSSVATRIVRYLNIVFFSIGVFVLLYKNRKSIDILHVHTAEWIAGLAAFSGRILRIPVLCKGADMPVFPPLQDVPVSWLFDKWRKDPYFIALTKAMKENLIENGVSQECIRVIPNGVQTVDLPVSVEKNSNFLFIGNFSQTAAHKAFDILIQAWAVVQKKRPAARLIMLGGGDIAQWQEYARNLNCADSIHFAGYQKDILPFIQLSCCLLLPSRKEGISNALLEAQSYGLPAIVSDIPGNTEVVTHRKNGFVVPVGDVLALANAVIEMFDDSNFREVLGGAAKEEIEERFSMEKVAEKTYAFYCELTAGDLR